MAGDHINPFNHHHLPHKTMEIPNTTHQNNPLVFVSAPPPPTNRTPTSWMELALQGKSINLCVNAGNQPIVLFLQDPAFLVQIVKEGMDQAVEVGENKYGSKHYSRHTKWEIST